MKKVPGKLCNWCQVCKTIQDASSENKQNTFAIIVIFPQNKPTSGENIIDILKVNTLRVKECNTGSYNIYEANKCTVKVHVKFRPTEIKYIKDQIYIYEVCVLF
jgi:hypothetical protein